MKTSCCSFQVEQSQPATCGQVGLVVARLASRGDVQQPHRLVASLPTSDFDSPSSSSLCSSTRPPTIVTVKSVRASLSLSLSLWLLEWNERCYLSPPSGGVVHRHPGVRGQPRTWWAHRYGFHPAAAVDHCKMPRLALPLSCLSVSFLLCNCTDGSCSAANLPPTGVCICVSNGRSTTYTPFFLSFFASSGPSMWSLLRQWLVRRRRTVRFRQTSGNAFSTCTRSRRDGRH